MEELVKRINELAQKAKTTGLTPEEITARLSAQKPLTAAPVIEPDELAAYLDSCKDNRFQTFNPD